MDSSEAYKFCIDYVVGWSRITFLTLTKPIARFELAPIDSNKMKRGSVHTQPEVEYWLHPKLLSYAFLSILIGLSINALIPKQYPRPDLLTSMIIIFIYWIMSGSVLHLFCVVLRGRGKYLQTLSVSIQVLGTLYVVTSFFALLVTSILLIPSITDATKLIPMIGITLAKNPIFVFFITGTILNMIYLPISMKPIHGFGWIRTVVIAILPPLTVWIAIAIYIQYGIPMYQSVPIK